MALQEAAAASSLRGLAEGVATHGLFCSFYNDTGSHRFLMPEAGDRVSKTILTPVDRSLKKLGTVYIAAYSPQARGRSECVFLTLQVRLPKDLKLVGISTLDSFSMPSSKTANSPTGPAPTMATSVESVWDMRVRISFRVRPKP